MAILDTNEYFLYFFRFKTEDEAILIANMTSSGLAGTADCNFGVVVMQQ